VLVVDADAAENTEIAGEGYKFAVEESWASAVIESVVVGCCVRLAAEHLDVDNSLDLFAENTPSAVATAANCSSVVDACIPSAEEACFVDAVVEEYCGDETCSAGE
jgi:hypothetical protein